MPPLSREAAGTAAAAAGALAYGITIVVNRTLATRGFGPQSVLGIRFGVAAAALLLVMAALGQPLLPERGERLRALLLGAIGYAVESSLFYSALERGSAGAVALLFYSYPAMVTIAELLGRQVHASRRLVAALVLSGAGTAVIVAGGERLAISRSGIAFALASAAGFSAYLLASSRIVPRTHALTNAAWVAAGAALSLLTQGAVLGGLRAPGASWWLMILNGVATAAAFGFMFTALKRLGASRTAVVMTLEAASAVVLAALVLHESLAPVQLVGGAAVLGATVLIARMKQVELPVTVEEP